jgi:hypothetical protein
MHLLADISLRFGESWSRKSKRCAFGRGKNIDSVDSGDFPNLFIDKKKDQILARSILVCLVLCYYATVQSVEDAN